jgi:hemerythrin-like domain-containing protein
MKAFEILEEEHERIVEMLDILDALCRQLKAGAEVPDKDLFTVVNFLQRYADTCHHAKEEHVLFPALHSVGMPRIGGPIGVMMTEHVEGRALVAKMDRAAEARHEGEPGSMDAFVSAARDFIGLLRNHISKENQVLFQMGRQALARVEEAQLLVDYERLEARETAAGEKAELLGALAELRSRYP